MAFLSRIEGRRLLALIPCIGLFLLLIQSFSLAEFNHPQFHWRVIETPHFLIHYHEGEEAFAQESARIAEEVYPFITSDLGYFPIPKIPIIIENISDITGGYTSILEGKIVIQAQSDPARTSGTLSWPREVIAHELTHLVMIAAFGESILPLRRIMGSLVLPMWFIEGLAQFEAEEWHSLKEMQVGQASREGKVLSEADLGAFYFFDGSGRTAGYYQSDSFVRYIFQTYGRDKIARILSHLRTQPIFELVGEVGLVTGEGLLYPSPRFLSFNQTLMEVIGKDSSALYVEWRNWIEEKYSSQRESESLLFAPEKLLVSWGRRSQHPVFSPRGDSIAFVSNQGYDYAIFDLYLMDLKTRKMKKLDQMVDPYFSFSPEGDKIIYAKTRFYPSRRSFLTDLYEVDVKSGQMRRLTFGLRASEPSFSPDGKRALLVKNEGGNSNLCSLDMSTGEVLPLTHDKDGLTQNFSPSFSPRGDSIVFVSSRRGQRDIYLLDLESQKIISLTSDEADDRSPVFSPDGKRIYFISNREGGIFNLFSLDPEVGKVRQHTRVVSGVFEPNISPDGEKILVSGYKEGKFSLYLLSLEDIIEVKLSNHNGGRAQSLQVKYREEDTRKIYPSSPYRPSLKLHYILPWFSFGPEESLFSLEGYASDYLERHNLYFSTLLGEDVQYDLRYINRTLEPTLWTNFYKVRGYRIFSGILYPTQVEGEEIGLDYYLSHKQGVRVDFSRRYLDTYLVSASGEWYRWQGKLSGLGGVWVFSDMLPVADPELHPRGKTLRLGVEYSSKALESDLEYTAYRGEFRGYGKIGEGGSLALRILAKRVENKQDFPKILFSLGSDPYFLGWDSLRGYPRDFGVVGENLLLSSLEYRFLLMRRMGGSPAFYLDRLGAVLFFDMGDVFSDRQELELKRDLGGELRLRTLLFGKSSLTFRLGIAWPLDEEERRGRVFFAIGEAF
jgi:hypothetical protein